MKLGTKLTAVIRKEPEMTNTPEEDYRQISEIQHFAFCRRQWALIHIEQQWKDNLRTTEGEIMHKRVHDADSSESRGDRLIIRGMRVKSDKLHCIGICDVVEFYRSEGGIELYGRKGKWIPRPVEYKRGKPKVGQEDKLQLCAQAMCIEEMLICSVPEGDLFYGEPHRRTTVVFSESLRKEVKRLFDEMNTLYKRGSTPRVKPQKGCRSCSLNGICLPKLNTRSVVEDYIRIHLEGQI